MYFPAFSSRHVEFLSSAKYNRQSFPRVSSRDKDAIDVHVVKMGALIFLLFSAISALAMLRRLVPHRRCICVFFMCASLQAMVAC